MNLRKEHRREQGQAAQRDFDDFWHNYLQKKTESMGLDRPFEVARIRCIARLAFFAGAFKDFRDGISDDDFI